MTLLLVDVSHQDPHASDYLEDLDKDHVTFISLVAFDDEIELVT